MTVSAAAADRWTEFDPSPLTVLYPEAEAISNPPFFHWAAHPEAKRYRLRVEGLAASETYETHRNFFTPERALPPGLYAVTVVALDSTGNQISASSPHEFRTTEDRPGIEANLSRLDIAAGTPFAFPPHELAAIREATGERGEYRDRLLRSAREPQHERLRRLAEPESYTDGKWNHAQWTASNTLSGIVEDTALRLALAFRLTDDESLAEASTALLLTVAAWDPDGSTGVWANDHSAWAILNALALGRHLLRERWTPEQDALVTEAIVARARDLYRFLNPFVGKVTAAGMMNDPDNNHPWFCAAALGIGGLALLGEHPEAEAWVVFAAQLFHGVFLPRGGACGGWHEGIDYWSYTLYFVFQFADALATATGLDLYAHPWLRHTALFKIYTHPPRGGYVPFGSCKHSQPTAFDKLVMMRLASRYDDPAAWEYVDAIRHGITNNRLRLALPWSERSPRAAEAAAARRSEVDAPAPAFPSLPPAVHFHDIGWVVANSDVFDPENQILFAMRSGKFFGRRFGHSHADQNHFVVTAGGEKLIWDAGFYDGYLTPHHRGYAVRSQAHNVILVGGEGQVVFTPGADGRIREFEHDGATLRVEGEIVEPIVYGGRLVHWRRAVEYDEDRRFVVRDDIFAAEADRLSWLLHSEYPIVYHPAKKTIRIEGERYAIEGVLETDVALDALLTTTFPDPPGPPNIPHPDQYHLELKTVPRLETWKPVFRFTIAVNEL